MLSVLIPIYNYNVIPLVHALHKQLMGCGLPFEIICMDDHSNAEYISENSKIESLSHTSLLKSAINNGRTKTRQLLSDTAKFDWLLFLDADTLPISDTFISDYTSLLNSKNEVVFGGFAYDKTKPNGNTVLRWKYGSAKEEIDAALRNSNPYKVIISANFLIQKEVFHFINSKITFTGYGLDNYFGSLLKEHSIKVYHINNPVLHLGIEQSDVYLKKMKQAIQTLLLLVKQNAIKSHDNDLLSLFLLLKKLKLNFVFSYIYKTCNTRIEKQLLGTNPSISLLQFYRILYMCHYDLNCTKN